MASKLFLVVVFVFNLITFATAVAPEQGRTQPSCHDNESFALLQFKESLISDCGEFGYSLNYSRVSSWMSKSNDCCKWSGVKCDENMGHVVSLNLSSSCLFGTINSNSSLFQLIHLQKLNLANNDFSYSKIPTSFTHLSRLTNLNLSSSGFFDQIPLEILGLSKLVSLDLSYNDLELPEFGLRNMAQNLINLKELNLISVYMFSKVPITLANLSSLTSLFLEDCDLHGDFPIEIFSLPNLQSINLKFNYNLKGSMPEFNQSNPFQSLELSYTSFFSKLPISIGNLKFLQHVGVTRCNFFGPIPSSFGNLAQLLSLRMSENRFYGDFPIDIFHLPNLKELEVGFNENIILSLVEFNRSSPLEFLEIYNMPSPSNLLHSIGNLKSLFSFMCTRCNISRPILSSLGNLTQLIMLDLEENNFYGSIHEFISKLVNLEYLNLGLNNLIDTMEFESLLKLKNLHSLYLFNTNISLPYSVCNLTQLTRLELEGNNFHGSIPKLLSKLISLEYLRLDSNNSSGIMEFDLFLKLKNLHSLILSSNNISLLTKPSSNATSPKLVDLTLRDCHLHEFPHFLRNQDRLWSLDLSNNEIHGQVPKWMSNAITNTKHNLNLSFNFLTGFDEFLAFSSSLIYLGLDSNKLQGSLPIPPPFIIWYSAPNNNLTGEIPNSICNLSSISALDLSNNSLSGSLPQCLSNLSDSLLVLNLHKNNFHGTIPQAFLEGNQLKIIDFSQNQLWGLIPRSLANCTKLEVLNLGHNKVNDIFPSWLSGLTKLKVLILQSNKLYGIIGNSKTPFDFPSLHIVDLSNNNIAGQLPFQYFKTWKAMQSLDAKSLTYVEVFVPYEYSFSMTFTIKGNEIAYKRILDFFIAIDLSNNKFEGEIPKVIGDLKRLIFLNLSNNFFTGHIPSSLGNLILLESLDLSQNKLSGAIPLELVQLSFLEFFNVSQNHLRGFIPFGKQFDTFSNTSFSDNPKLCGSPLSKKCENSEHSHPQLSTIVDNQIWKSPFEFGWKVVVMGYGCGFVVGLVLGITNKHDWLTTFVLGNKQ